MRKSCISLGACSRYVDHKTERCSSWFSLDKKQTHPRRNLVVCTVHNLAAALIRSGYSRILKSCLGQMGRRAMSWKRNDVVHFFGENSSSSTLNWLQLPDHLCFFLVYLWSVSKEPNWLYFHPGICAINICRCPTLPYLRLLLLWSLFFFLTCFSSNEVPKTQR